MNSSQRLQLQQMLKENDVSDQTNLIRELKHCDLIVADVNKLLMIKQKYKNNLSQEFDVECMMACSFLYTCYTDLYNKIKKDEINLTVLNKFLNVLKLIENGEIDQHDGSFLVGTYLKEIYVDSALKKSEKLNKENNDVQPIKKLATPININWKQFKEKN